ncbi:hypothetical protein AB0L80_43115 [Streptomyces sp. NPDC052069]
MDDFELPLTGPDFTDHIRTLIVTDNAPPVFATGSNRAPRCRGP